MIVRVGNLNEGKANFFPQAKYTLSWQNSLLYLQSDSYCDMTELACEI